MRVDIVIGQQQGRNCRGEVRPNFVPLDVCPYQTVKLGQDGKIKNNN